MIMADDDGFVFMVFGFLLMPFESIKTAIMAAI